MSDLTVVSENARQDQVSECASGIRSLVEFIQDLESVTVGETEGLLLPFRVIH